MSIYFDHNATTPVHSSLLSSINDWVKEWANPSSIYSISRMPKKILRETRINISKKLGVHPLEIIFTSGGSESNNLALKGILNFLRKMNKDTYVVSSVEHPSVLKTAKHLSSLGLNVHYIPVHRHGEMDLDFLHHCLTKYKVGLVSVMAANNETGVIHPISEISEMAHKHGALLHTDAVQLMGKTVFDFKSFGVDLASFSAHKFYALKGAGFLYCRKGLPLESLIHGGGQERSRRAGTENTLSIAAMNHMIQSFDLIENQLEQIRNLRNHFELEILKAIPKIEITAQQPNRLVNTSHLIIEGVDGENLLMNLDLKGFSVSTGAACSAGSPEPSPALLAMGFTRAEAQSSLRVSFGQQNTLAEVDLFVLTLKQVVPYLREIKNQI